MTAMAAHEVSWLGRISGVGLQFRATFAVFLFVKYDTSTFGEFNTVLS